MTCYALLKETEWTKGYLQVCTDYTHTEHTIIQAWFDDMTRAQAIKCRARNFFPMFTTKLLIKIINGK
jgi:hypothetical protein